MTELELTLKSQTPLLVVATWQPPAEAVGYMLYIDGRRVGHSPDPNLAQFSFRKPDGKDHVYTVQALGALASGVLEVPNPKPQTERPTVVVWPDTRIWLDTDIEKDALAWPAVVAVGGTHLICAADDSEELAELERVGGKAWATVGHWDDNIGEFSLTDTAALTIAEQAVANYPGVIQGWYLADEPSLARPEAPYILARRAILLNQVLPGVEVVIGMYDTTLFSTFKEACSAYAIDGLPSHEPFHPSEIANRARAADTLGIRYYGVVAAFTAEGTHKLPTSAAASAAAWAATRQIGSAVYEWGPAGGPTSTWLQNRPELLSALKGIDGFAAGDILAELAFGARTSPDAESQDL